MVARTGLRTPAARRRRGRTYRRLSRAVLVPCRNIEGGEDIFNFAVSKISMATRFIGANRTDGRTSQPAQRTRDSRSRR